MRFTDRQIQALKPRAERYEVREDGAHGLGNLAVRVSPNGGKSWGFVYSIGGRNRRLTLGRYPEMTVADAHAAASAALAKLQAGVDPGTEAVNANVEARKALTVADLAVLYLDQHARKKKRPGSVAKDEGMLRKDVVPTLGARKARDVERRDVRELLRAIVDRGAPIQANRTLALLRKVYNWGVSEDHVPGNPCLGVKAPGEETQRDRMLGDAELQTVLANLAGAGMSEEVRLALRLQLLTAQRCGEVMGLRWDEIDLAAGWWTIPAGKAKNGKSHRVPLSKQALAVLAEAKVLNPDRAHVFPSPRGDKPMVPTAVGLAVRRTQERFEGVAPWTPHDLRRTAASHMTGMGIPRLVVAKLLNHTDRAITAVYDRHSYDREKREALEAWGRKVEALEAAARRGLSVVEGEAVAS